jgi:DNA polymerase III delta prime subunit
MVDTNVWTKKYAPRDLSSMILNPGVRTQLENILANPQNLILYGSSGIGKGTFTEIFLEKTKFFFLEINASNETGIDVVRTTIRQFSEAPSPKYLTDPVGTENKEYFQKIGHLKIVVLNEAENFSPEAQAALRELMERVERITKYIFMTNRIDKIDQAIQSRCVLIEIKDPPISDITTFMKYILDNENVSYENEAIDTLVINNYPDIRKTINHIKSNCRGNDLVIGNTQPEHETIDQVLLDLRMYITLHNIEKRQLYNSIRDNLETHVSERQFYYLLSGKPNKKISNTKKSAVLKSLLEYIPFKSWHREYIMLRE